MPSNCPVIVWCVTYCCFSFVRFSLRGAESTTRLLKWSEPPSAERRFFSWDSDPDWSWNCDLLPSPGLQAVDHPDQCDLLSDTLIFHSDSCIALSQLVQESPMCFFHERRCTNEFFKRIIKCFQETLFACDFCVSGRRHCFFFCLFFYFSTPV